MSTIKVQKLSTNATIPQKGSKDAAGYDLYSAEASTIPPGKRSLIKTDISIDCESYNNFYFRVAPRSGLALKGIDIGAGVIDKDYRGTIGIIVMNNSDSRANFRNINC
jgi:dUTP pyrophosphatase